MNRSVTPGSVPSTEYVEGLMSDQLQDTWARYPLLGNINPYYYNETSDPRRVTNLRDAITGALTLYALNDTDNLGKFSSVDGMESLQTEGSEARIQKLVEYAKGRSVSPSDIGMNIVHGIGLLLKSNLVTNIGEVVRYGVRQPSYRATPNAKRILKAYPEIPFTVMPKTVVGKGCGVTILSEFALGGVLALDHIVKLPVVNSSNILTAGGGVLGAALIGTQIAPFFDARNAYRKYEEHYGHPPTGPNLRLVK